MLVSTFAYVDMGIRVVILFHNGGHLGPQIFVKRLHALRSRRQLAVLAWCGDGGRRCARSSHTEAQRFEPPGKDIGGRLQWLPEYRCLNRRGYLYRRNGNTRKQWLHWIRNAEHGRLRLRLVVNMEAAG